MSTRLKSAWQRATDLWNRYLDTPVRDRAHDVHEHKETLFTLFFERTVIGRWINHFTTANQWSIARFPLAAVLLATLLAKHIALVFIIILVIGFTDLIDGPLARHQGTASPDGMRLESLADSVCVWTMFIAMFFLTSHVELKALFGTAGALEVIRLAGVAYYEKRLDLATLIPNQSGKYKFVFFVAGALTGVLSLQSPQRLFLPLTRCFLGIGVYLSFHSLIRHRLELETMVNSSQR